MSQGSLVNPTSGTLSGLSLVNNLNLAFDAIATMNSGAAPPANAAEAHPPGQFWLNTSTSPSTIEISDGTGNWLTVGYLDPTNHIYTAKGATGTGFDWWGSAASLPPGSILAYGQTEPIASYPALAAVFGTTYGGDGVTTFGMPDMRGRVAAGKDDMGGSAAGRLTSSGSGINGTTLGASGGGETHVLTVNELAVHSHTYTYQAGSQSSGQNYAAGSYYINVLSGTTATAGAGAAHLNAQPTIVANYAIWF